MEPNGSWPNCLGSGLQYICTSPSATSHIDGSIPSTRFLSASMAIPARSLLPCCNACMEINQSSVSVSAVHGVWHTTYLDDVVRALRD